MKWLRAAALAMVLAALATAGAAAPRSATLDLIDQMQGEGMNVTTTAKVWIKADRVRMETRSPMFGETLMISDGSFVYVLDPAQKKGQKRPVPTANGKKQGPWELVTTEVSALLRKGKKVGRETINGIACDVYTGSESREGGSGSFKAWIATIQSTPLPIKVVLKQSMSRPGATISRTRTFSIRNLKVNAPVADSQFALPRGYTIAPAPATSPMPGMPRPGRP